MSELEKQLGRALREPQPPEDLARKVLARVAEQPKPKRTFLFMKVAAAIGIIAVLTATGFRYERQRAERLGRQQALAEVAEAFRLVEQQLKPFRHRIESMKVAPAPISQGEKK